MISIVYPYMESLSQGSKKPEGMCELKWSIRSLCKYVNFDFDVVIVGDKPSWYNGAYIQTDAVGRGKAFTKAFDIANKLQIIAGCEEISQDFIYMYDDIYCINECTLDDFKKVIAMGTANRNTKMTTGSTTYQRIFANTVRVMDSDNFYMYETHLPRMLNRAKLALIHRSYNLSVEPLLFSTLYFNEFAEKPDIILKENNPVKAGVYEKTSVNKIKSLCSGKLWLNHSENAYSSAMENYLNEMFPNKCRYEI